MTQTKAKPKSRSPIKRAPLSGAGDSTYDESTRVILDGLGFPVTVAGIFSVWAIKDWIQWASNTPPMPGWSTAFALVAIVWAWRSARRAIKRSQQLRLGAQGERSVAEVLDALRRDGYEVFHDLDGDGFNIDHVIIGPPGVFVIETKTHRKRPGGDVAVVFDGTKILVDGHVPDRDPIVQVRAAVNHVRRSIEQSTTLKPFIKPVILYPGWYTKSASHNDVWVLNETAFPKFLEHEAVRLREDEVKLIASAIASRLRASQLAGT